jgi:adenosine deaminase
MTTDRDLRTLPKAHLHIHLEGAMRPDTLSELCARYAIERPFDTRGKRFPDFRAFNDVYAAAALCIRSRDDLARLILEVAEDAAQQGVIWIEPAFDADRFCGQRAGSPDRLFQSQAEGWQFALEAAQSASLKTGVGIGFMSAIDRSRPIDGGLERAQVTVELVAAQAHLIRSGVPGLDERYPGIVAFGLHGNEQGNPPEPFADAFAHVRNSTTLLSTPHAGEIAPSPGGGAASVASAIAHLKADRILHGVLATEDPDLIRRIADTNVCFDVCPSSNVALSVCDSIESHPLPGLLAAGVHCDLGSDDPLLFGPDLVDEFELCRTGMGLDDAALATLAHNSFIHSGAPPRLKEVGRAAVDEWLAGTT